MFRRPVAAFRGKYTHGSFFASNLIGKCDWKTFPIKTKKTRVYGLFVIKKTLENDWKIDPSIDLIKRVF
jgi:hypothetical protein